MGDGFGKAGKNFGEYARPQILRNFFFIKPCFVERISVQTATGGIPILRQEGGATEKQIKQAQGVFRVGRVQFRLYAGNIQRCGKVNFEKFFRAGTRILPVEPPDCAIGEDAPFDFAIGRDIRPREVTQHLRRGRAGVKRFAGIAPVERA